jgi:monovalent cation/proton antiporter MnhG/PhaG subunit
MLASVVDVLGVAALVGGLLLATVGLIGLLRMDDVFAQLHAAGLVTGPAVIAVMLASIATGDAEVITSALLVLLFVLITAPLSGHAIARETYRRRRPEADPDRADAADGT